VGGTGEAMATRRKKPKQEQVETEPTADVRIALGEGPMSRRTKEADKLPTDLKIEPFQQRLPVMLTEQELLGVGDRAAHVSKEAHEAEEERKEADATAKATVKRLQNEADALLATVRDKREYRLVSCERRYEYKTGRVIELRTDTGEQLSERPMRDDERQTELGLEDDDADYKLSTVKTPIIVLLSPDRVLTHNQIRSSLKQFDATNVARSIAALIDEGIIERCEEQGEEMAVRLVRS
jgi:hypothetical protein